MTSITRKVNVDGIVFVIEKWRRYNYTEKEFKPTLDITFTDKDIEHTICFRNIDQVKEFMLAMWDTAKEVWNVIE